MQVPNSHGETLAVDPDLLLVMIAVTMGVRTSAVNGRLGQNSRAT
jgi:hypothetical protein